MQAFFCINNNVIKFGDFFKDKAKRNPATPVKRDINRPALSGVKSVKHRQQNPLGNANKSGKRKHLNLMPDYLGFKEGSNKKIEDLKALPIGSGREYTLNSKDIGFIVKHFLKDKQPVRGELYTLGGKMGIQMYYDNRNNCWKIKK
jgi:hypothetical protein